jgi:putative tryptophan/tyrosine transport system substrate-binding protein
MNRRDSIAALIALGGGSRAARAQPTAKIARIGFLSFNSGGDPRGRDGFARGLRELGYIDGRNIVVEYRDADGKAERLAALAAELVALKVALIVAPSTPAAQAAKQATMTIPIVFAGAADPVADGFVVSLALPGGNVTGLSNLGADLVGKRLELLKQAVPRLTRVAVLWGLAPGRTAEDMLKSAGIAARALGIQLQLVEVPGPADLDRAFTEMTRARADALTILPVATFFSERKQIIEMAARNRLPAIYTSRVFVADGGLMAYGADLPELLRRAASYADRILKGARPSELPVEQATKFELVINRTTAKALGLTIPQTVLLNADEVIG